MLAAGQRLRRRDEFTTTVRSGRRAGRGGLVVHLTTSPLTPAADTDAAGGATARVGFIIPRAVGTAVTRNLIRRRLRHLMRDRLDRLPAGAALVIRVRSDAVGRSYPELGADLDSALAAAQRSGRGRSRE